MPEHLDALEYHRLTKHSVASITANRHYLDWDNQPLPFKIYSTLEPIRLPRDFGNVGAPNPALDLQVLARLLYYSAGITRRKTYPGGQEHYFRAAACTGALYHIDVYVVCGELPGLAAGVYHVGPHDFALRRLRSGDHRAVLVEASGGEAATTAAPVVLVFSSTFWRNAWKYESRTYRHCFWDSGTILANLFQMTESAAIPARAVLGFADSLVNQLIDLDTQREVALACVALGGCTRQTWLSPLPVGSLEASSVGLGTESKAIPPAPAMSPLACEVLPLSLTEIDYPAIRAAHAASSFDSPEQVRAWRQHSLQRRLPEPSGRVVALPAPTNLDPLPFEQVIARRGSTRQFARAPIAYEALSYILGQAFKELPTDLTSAGPAADISSAPWLNDIYLIVNAVDGLDAGAYVYRPDRHGLELLKSGSFRTDAGHLDLGQELAADASVNLYALSDLDAVVGAFGNRGYRAASLEAAVLGGRIYLAAYSIGLGATGLTFFDDEVTAFFSPHAAGKGVMFLTAVGRPRKR